MKELALPIKTLNNLEILQHKFKFSDIDTTLKYLIFTNEFHIENRLFLPSKLPSKLPPKYDDFCI